MNLSRFALAFLALVPTALFIAAAETAPDPASPGSAAPANKPAATSPAAATQSAVATSAPLRTSVPALSLPGTESADVSATGSILAAIKADPGMAGADVSVHTDNGVVTLTGIVRNREQAAIASAYANRQLGVLRVDNELSVPAQ